MSLRGAADYTGEGAHREPSDEEDDLPDVTLREIDQIDSIFDGVARRARAELGVTAWGMQVLTLPPNWDGYPNHKHDSDAFDPNQEEVYIPLEGSATLVADDAEIELRPGTMARVGPGNPARSSSAPRASVCLHSAGARALSRLARGRK